ncbi:hypothetical protein [Legionella quateirensis]|uniref:Fe-S protein n=1 Tax=Legionella quateirensis TaxID=45072 RepID=A0A378KUT8_9GAMM|nr:hypothetical protein [Legionella quateirensis]KTD48347.1 Fe-S protein [Legionella quateirensis]STY18323.1 Fe-S protein [Legionella quateirensis]
MHKLKHGCFFWMLLLYCFKANALEPWFTGPAIAISGKTVPKGVIAIQPYVFYTDIYGAFNNNKKKINTPDIHQTSTDYFLFYGLNDFMDLQGLVSLDQRSQFNRSSDGIEDSRILMGIQLLKGELHSWKPFVKVTLAQYIPTGKYSDLSPELHGLDAHGTGAYSQQAGLVIQKYYLFKNQHYLANRSVFSYRFPSSVHVDGFNAYGGGFGTNGLVKTGYVFQADTAIEYQLTQNWVAVLELNYIYNNKSTFSGIPGVTHTGIQALTGSDNQYSFSYLPGIEYNLSSKIGILASLWMPIQGKNSGNYITGLVTVYATLN